MFLSFFRISFLKKCTDMLRGQQSFIQFNFTSTVFVIWKPQQVFKMKNALTNKQTNKQKRLTFSFFFNNSRPQFSVLFGWFLYFEIYKNSFNTAGGCFWNLRKSSYRGYKRANGIKWANRVTTTRLCQTQCRNTRSVFIGLLSFLEVFLLPFCKFLLKN